MATTSVPDLSARSQIAGIQVSAWPEGPSLLLHAGTPNFDQAVAAVPIPLPRRRVDLSQCHVGGTVTIRLLNAASVTYGPCKRPVSIKRLGCIASGAPPNCYQSKP